MGKIFVLLGFSLIFILSSCDRSIESRLNAQKKQESEVIIQKNERKDTVKATNQIIAVSEPPKIEETQKIEVESPKNVEEVTTTNSPAKEKIELGVEKPKGEFKANVKINNQEANIKDKKVVAKSTLEKNKIQKNLNLKEKDKIDTVSSIKKGKEFTKVKIHEQNGQTKVKQAEKLKSSEKASVASFQDEKDSKSKEKTTSIKTLSKKEENEGAYDNGKLVSNFSEEELRLGAQKPLSKEEIKYFKMQCRYALMSEQDIIENGCQSKKVAISR